MIFTGQKYGTMLYLVGNRFIIGSMLTVVIQAGGKSNRMGQNKALMPFLGAPLIRRIVDRLEPAADEIFLVSNEPAAFNFLNLPVVMDIIPDIGALGGLYTALSVARQPNVAVIACDMPFANPELILAQERLLITENVDVVIPQTPDGLEPLHAVYRRETCLPEIVKAIAEGNRRMIGWFPAVRVRKMQASEIEKIDDSEFAFFNVNTPEDFSKAEELATVRRI